MNRLSLAKQAQVVRCLIEGSSIRATVRMTDVAKNTVVKLLRDLGKACAEYHDLHVRNLNVKRLQCDEIWSFVGAKAKNVSPEKMEQGWGDAWTWVGIDADTKLVVSYLVGGRDAEWAVEFMEDCADRIESRVQITTDGHKAYLEAVEGAFGMDADYAMLQKIYGTPDTLDTTKNKKSNRSRYIGAELITISGKPDQKHISTSFVERQNLSMRMGIRRFTRKSNGFSKKVENHQHSVALHFMYYNFCRVHQTLRVTPAMEAGIASTVWTIEYLCSLIPEPKISPCTIDRELLRRALENVA